MRYNSVIVRWLFILGYIVCLAAFSVHAQPALNLTNEPSALASALAVNSSGRPVVAYVAADTSSVNQVYVRRWTSDLIDTSQLDRWSKLTNFWEDVGGSASGRGVSVSDISVYNPAIAVHGDEIFLAWQQPSTNLSTNIYVKIWSGGVWTNFGGSAVSGGVSRLVSGYAEEPMIGVGKDRMPVVAWRATGSGGSPRIYVAKWNGIAWQGLGTSYSSGLAATYAGPASLVVNDAGYPAVAWQDNGPNSDLIVKVMSWNGSSWVNRGSAGLANGIADMPSLASDGTNKLFLAWQQLFYAPPNLIQIYAAQNTGGTSWQSMGGSMVYPGVSGATVTNTPFYPKIAFASRPQTVSVSWLAETNGANAVLVRQHALGGASWTAVGSAGSYPGIVTNSVGTLANFDFALNDRGWPSVSLTEAVGDEQKLSVYQLQKDFVPPSFTGLGSAIGTVNQRVVLSWPAATDNNSSNIVYRIYQGTGTYDCYDPPSCSVGDVFNSGTIIAVITNQTIYTNSFQVNDYENRCYGVRATDASGNTDENISISYAFSLATNALGEPIDCLDFDSNTNGIPNWWEQLWFGSVTGVIDSSNSAATNCPGDGLSISNAYLLGTDPRSCDSDGDGISDTNEYANGYNPALADTDGDGLDDGVERDLIGTNRVLTADSNANGLSDGDMYQLGFTNSAQITGATTNFNRLFVETFETNAPGWTLVNPEPGSSLNYWHLSTAQPVPRSNQVIRMNDPSSNKWYRFANDFSTTNINAHYNYGRELIAALDSPVIPGTASASNLFVRWKEFYRTEADKDKVAVFIQSNTRGLERVSADRSGQSGGWQLREENISDFAGEEGVRLRFLFRADSRNNLFPGWFIDDVVVYEGATIAGWVRDVDGKPVEGAQVNAIGQGGITNRLSGHDVVNPGKIFGSAITASDGSYTISGLPFGTYFIKSQATGYRPEFWNGRLFTNNYVFGHQDKPGVFDRSKVGPDGRVSLSATNLAADCHFELERGEEVTYLGVSMTGVDTNRYPVTINGSSVSIWNGSNIVSNAAMRVYQTRTSLLPPPTNGVVPSWSNPGEPDYFSGLSPGNFLVGAESGSPLVNRAELNLRSGEFTAVNLQTNTGLAAIYVTTRDGISYPIYLNGVSSGENTPGLLKVQAGRHVISLQKGQDVRIAPKMVDTVMGRKTDVVFEQSELSDTTAHLAIRTFDAWGEEIFGAAVLLNGSLVDTSSVPTAVSNRTPLSINGIYPGIHHISILGTNGLLMSENRQLYVAPGTRASISFNLSEADLDFDGVGDRLEIESYTNLFSYAGTNYFVYTNATSGAITTNALNLHMIYGLFRDAGVRLNPFTHDTDGDGMADDQEIGYDGATNTSLYARYARTTLASNAIQTASSIKTFFRGRFLEGAQYFRGTTNMVMSINGDRITATALTNIVESGQPVYTVFSGIHPTLPDDAISYGHPVNTPVYADTDPTNVDTDDDGMWDGFEFVYKHVADPGAPGGSRYILEPIAINDPNQDSDWDELRDVDEFLGVDKIPNTTDWLNPGNADTDGDTLPDGWEWRNGLDARNPNDGLADTDGDGLNNQDEFDAGALPLNPDSDNDGLSDGPEYSGSRNFYKQQAYFSHKPGSSNPAHPDTDGDGLFDGLEIALGTNPNDPDTDGDGMPDGFEVLDAYGNLRPVNQRLNPLDPTDADDDYDLDGLSNLQEYLVRDALYGRHPTEFPLFQYTWYGYVNWFDGRNLGWSFNSPPFRYNEPVWDYSTDPFNGDSDGDGMSDLYEVTQGLHPFDPVFLEGDLLVRYPVLSTRGDLDADGLWNIKEAQIGTDSWVADTDNDGLDDGEELHAMHRGDPLRQDTDADGLFDGVGVDEKWGEVESKLQRRFEFVPLTTPVSWTLANLLAAVYAAPGEVSHLATVGSAREFMEMLEALDGATATTIAIGAKHFVATNNSYIYQAGTTIEPFIFHNFGPNLPVQVVGVKNAVVVDALGNYDVVDETDPVVDGLLIEYSGVSTVTNHYDRAYNDLWVLSFPTDAGLGAPYWERINVDTNSLLPPPRWGHAMTYVPGYEIKDQTDLDDQWGPGTHILMDNRKLVVIGGASGVEKYADVWEYWIKSNSWQQSVVSLSSLGAGNYFSPEISSGLSDLSAVLLMGYSNTRLPPEYPPGDRTWNDTGILFGEPKNRPWDRGYQDSSYDITFILGGWNDDHWYGFNEPLDTIYYKSTDDNNLILELSTDYENNIPASDVWQSDESRLIQIYSNSVPPTLVATLPPLNNRSRTYADLSASQDQRLSLENGGNDDRVPLGFYTQAEPTVVTNAIANGFEVITTYPTNKATAIRINRFPFRYPTDRIVTANLVFAISSAPAADLPLHIAAEYNPGAPDFNPTSEIYFWDEDEQTVPTGTPLQRAEGRGFVTPSVPFSIPAGFTGEFSVDVTLLLQLVALRGDWEGRALGFVITNDPAAVSGAIMKENSAFLRIWHDPSYRVDAQWHVSGNFQVRAYGDEGESDEDEGVEETLSEVPSKRKSFGMSYNWRDDRIIVFGGMNGRQVFDETYQGEPRFAVGPDVARVRRVIWEKIMPTNRPPARWGHSQVYDDRNNRVLIFGGFDASNRPLNDLWAYSLASTVTNTVEDEEGTIISNEVVVTDGGWLEITDFQDIQRPSPRGGAAMAWVGGRFYRDDNGSYRISRNRQKLVLFGGTDGKTYFNDTWYYDENEVNFDILTTNKSRWVLADPGGEQSQGPEPRAFAQMAMAQNAPRSPDPFVRILTNGNISVDPAFGPFKLEAGPPHTADGPVAIWMFGGRGGALATGPDTDRDLVPDGQEHALGGASSGRDPTKNALYSSSVNTNESVPFSYLRFGTYGGYLPGFKRPAIADLEAISYHERVHGWRMGYQYTTNFLAWQGYPLRTSFSNEYYEVGNELIWPVDRPDTNRLVYITGVDAFSADWINMWYQRFGDTNRAANARAWDLGIPKPAGLASNAAPPYARSGRWVYGTGLDANYPNNARLELYSPVFSLSLPNTTSTDPANSNLHYLVFHEWLDLADGDSVFVDVIRPATPADLYSRTSGQNKQPVSILPSRTRYENTTGEWRRVTVPLAGLGNESNLFFRFTLLSDSNKTAGGWYIDDIAIAQGGIITGAVIGAAGGADISLRGVNGDLPLSVTQTNALGYYGFGFLARGKYIVSSSMISVEVDLNQSNMVANALIAGFSVKRLEANPGGNVITWESQPGSTYRVLYCDDLDGPLGWQPISLAITASDSQTSYTDVLAPANRFYAVEWLPAP